MTESSQKPEITSSMLAQPVTDSFSHKSDEVLVTLFQTGERDVFRLLVERYQERVRNIIFSVFHDQSLIDDLAQEVFLKVYEALPRFRFESSFYTWLYRIAVNKSRDELRKRKVRRVFMFQSMDDGTEMEIPDHSSFNPQRAEAEELVARGLRNLPEKFRLPVILKDLEGMSYEEIAEVMQCEIGTVKSRLSRGREMLRRAVKPLLEEKI